ncbi:MAG: STAS domain-containing protein [Planctomycetes bacterium]|nr:STAS domain-containing protein [Planctomycetota bacterium]
MVKWSERGYVCVTRGDEVVYGQVVGLGNMNNCSPFQAYVSRMHREGIRQFVLDFSQCLGLDSTFLGVLVNMSLGTGEPCRVVVLNASTTVRRTLNEVGIDRLLTVHESEAALPDIPLRRLEPIEESDRDRAELMLNAHESLCRVDPSNLDRFGAFLAMLRRELGS